MIDAAAGGEVGADAWPQRLRSSAARLCGTSADLQAALLDERRFALLTDAGADGEAARDALREYHRLLVEALAALIDLSGHDSPEREYPDLSTWFEFKCPNVVFGRHTDGVAVPPPRPPA